MNTHTLLQLSQTLRQRHLKLTTAESCTGGMIAATMTDLAGSSDIFDRGFVTYSNQAKIDMLNVSFSTLETHGAVSEQTASEMAEGALRNSAADIAVSVTGIAGPSGGTNEKPVGLVYIAIAGKTLQTKVTRNIFSGDRKSIREQTVEKSLQLLLAAIH